MLLMKNIEEILLDHVVGEKLSEEEQRLLDEWMRVERNAHFVKVLRKDVPRAGVAECLAMSAGGGNEDNTGENS